MRLPVDPHRLFVSAPALGHGLRMALRWGALHSGLPVLMVAAVALVISWRVFKHMVRLSIEVVVAVAVLFGATRLGWITW